MIANDVPELLYHTVLTVIDSYQEPSGPTSSVYVLGTHSTLEAAKAFATSALQGLNYEPEEFTEYAVRSSKPWEHGDGVLVFAQAPAGQPGRHHSPPSRVRHAALRAAADNRLQSGPHGLRAVGKGSGDVRPSCPCMGGPEQFIECNVRESEEIANEWPFGEGMVAHAVAETRLNYVVTVRTIPEQTKGMGKR
ncbi:uncharacterized protein NECHADRAFT_89520 [Fusarium vanettenii 77-13-4]|uniref:Uncharacterized protein n=1 Tax=Fusarium vanettenii (strain ATCC MYA-4622 / CBS 123669 / FGSC 9596 / NRRL 45880 / 77-13-4) TaxID=660122 RepID=C7ZRG1_FUSV7|nr:uncharacterized protein NECHADRAFT_89520 [Fusarium vanettenii 77-13-4]EEU33393.1 hypothetical protein NECHADRAFT_89520 [Fusarium vanettenii 77-13-4]